MKCIVGLGNPGKKYALTRHNIGFMCLDHVAYHQNLTFTKENKFKGEVARYKDTILLKPHTFMNLSGESLRLLINYYNIEMEDVLVIYDDLDLEPGTIRLRPKGGSGGHNGLKSIMDQLGSNEFKRVRIGIGKNDLIDTKDYVLGKFLKQNHDVIKEAIKTTGNIVNDFVEDISYSKIMSKYNSKPLNNN